MMTVGTSCTFTNIVRNSNCVTAGGTIAVIASQPSRYVRRSELVEILLEAHKHIANLGRSTQFKDRVGDGVVTKDQEWR
jgi:hypothetical protein